MKEIDFDRAKLLMDIILEAGKHGPMYQHLMGEAQKELKDMIEYHKNQPRVVTPPDGPANSAVANKDGTFTRIPAALLKFANETEEEFRLRQEQHEKLMEAINANAANPDPSQGNPSNPRENERGPGDTRTTEEVNRDHTAAQDQQQKDDPNNPTQEQIEAERKAQEQAETQRVDTEWNKDRQPVNQMRRL